MSGLSVSGNLPAGDGNGLDPYISSMIEDPKKYRVALAIIDTKKITTDSDSGDIVPTVRIRRIELVEAGEDMKVAERLMRRALDKRMGREALPYDLEVDLGSAFGTSDDDS